MSAPAQPWIFSARFDSAFILAPALIVTGAALLLQGSAPQAIAASPWVWLALIVGVDVSHVYSTLFRTYLDRTELGARPLLYIMTPLLAWLGGTLLYSHDSLTFWRVLAYAAVFHFVRQQYGFMMIYSRQERGLPAWCKRLDKAAIYAATIYPLVYWHTHARAFQWFVEGDFLRAPLPFLAAAAQVLWIAILLAWAGKEVMLWRRGLGINVPRLLLLAGTSFSWFVGIVLFDNDLTFTATNVIAHGVPYMALIWGYGRNQARLAEPRRHSLVLPVLARLFTWKTVPFYLAVLFALAFVEEGLWDGFVWREHGQLFASFFQIVPDVAQGSTLQWLVPLLAVPQATHYILDAFIWRLHTPGTDWKDILFLQTSGKT